MSSDLAQLFSQANIDRLLSLCARAGEAIVGEYRGDAAHQYASKADESPLTRADIKSHRLIVQELASLTPHIPVLSEESSAEEVADRRAWSRLWMLDPLDGTREFLNRTGEFTINLALIDQHRPVLGILYLPLEHVAYVGLPGEGAWLYRQEAGGWQRTAIRSRSFSAQEGVVVLASRRHRNARLQRVLQFLSERAAPLQRLDSGSALKFAQLARGEGDCYPRFSPCCEWDVAAGHALVEAAGGRVVGLDGRPLTYNRRDSLLSPHFLAVGDQAPALWQELLSILR